MVGPTDKLLPRNQGGDGLRFALFPLVVNEVLVKAFNFPKQMTTPKGREAALTLQSHCFALHHDPGCHVISLYDKGHAEHPSWLRERNQEGKKS